MSIHVVSTEELYYYYQSNSAVSLLIKYFIVLSNKCAHGIERLEPLPPGKHDLHLKTNVINPINPSYNYSADLLYHLIVNHSLSLVLTYYHLCLCFIIQLRTHTNDVVGPCV